MQVSREIQRYKLIVAYRGTRYHGWQHQEMLPTYKGPKPPAGRGIPTIQENLKRALQKVIRHPLKVVGSSRTDAGVHAKGQLVHVDTDQTQIPLEGLRLATNHQLPDDILVRSIEVADENFDAIRSVESKRYQYSIWNAIDRNPHLFDMCWHRWEPLDAARMAEAAKLFVGEHDFASFARAKHGRFSSVRTVYSVTVSQRGPRIVIGVEGNGFLWHQVRIMVGTLVEIGVGKREPEEITDMLAACDRRAGGATAPPQGLWLQWVRTGNVLRPAELDEEMEEAAD